jgi:hypothetical protein
VRYDVPIFDPFGDRGDDYFHPGNDAAELLTHVAFTHEDISVLFGILNRSQSEREEKLIGKFIVVEFLSLDEHLTALVGLALSGRTGYPLNTEEATQLKRLNGEYTALRKPAEPAFREIRNKIAAHRDRGNLLTTARIWDGVDAGTVYRMAQPIKALYDFLKDLNIYKWTKSEQTEKGAVMAYVSPVRWDHSVNDERGEGPHTGESAR